MNNHNNLASGRSTFPWRVLGWGAVAVLLTLPLVLRFPWTVSDFLFAGMMFGTAGLAIELAVRASPSWRYRAGVAASVAASFLLVWVNGAVGFLGDENNPANLLFFGVIATALFGSVVARFRAEGMVFAMLAAAFVQLAIGALAIPMGWASPGSQGLYEVLLGSTLFIGLWLVAAGLFRWAVASEAAA
jgi:hypothetical protein